MNVMGLAAGCVRQTSGKGTSTLFLRRNFSEPRKTRITEANIRKMFDALGSLPMHTYDSETRSRVVSIIRQHLQP